MRMYEPDPPNGGSLILGGMTAFLIIVLMCAIIWAALATAGCAG